MAGMMPPGGPGAVNPLMLRPTAPPPGMPAVNPVNPVNPLAGAMPPRPQINIPTPLSVRPAPGPINPGVQGLPPPVERISDRVPVPKHHFPEEHHKHLHEKTMGEAFDDPDAQDFVRRVYDAVHRGFPDVPPKHRLEAIRDAYHAVKHGFMPAEMAGASVGSTARARHVAEQRDALAADREPSDRSR